MSEIGTFLKAVGQRWWALMSCAIFTGLGVFSAYANKNNTWIVEASFAAAVVCVFIACYLAWLEEHRKLLTEQAKNQGARIEGEILRASIDTKVYENGTWRSIDDGICLTILVEAVNRSQIDAWNRKLPTLEISFGAESHSGTFLDLPQSQYVLEFNDPTLAYRQMFGLLHSIWVGGSDWLPSRPRQGYLCFIVPGVDHKIIKLDPLEASIVLHIHDTLKKVHPIAVKDISVGKEFVRMYVPPQQIP